MFQEFQKFYISKILSRSKCDVSVNVRLITKPVSETIALFLRNAGTSFQSKKNMPQAQILKTQIPQLLRLWSVGKEVLTGLRDGTPRLLFGPRIFT